jgi:hypothetical protein
MTDQLYPRCSNLEEAGFNYQKASEDVWEAMLSAGVFIEGECTFASGIQATLKADAEQLYNHPRQLDKMLGLFATFPCVEDADVLLYVPDGMRAFVTQLGQELEKPVAQTQRRPDSSSKYDFIFRTEEDRDLATSAQLPLIGEDVVTTLGSVAALRSLLGPNQDVHSLALLLRGSVNPTYRVGLTDHYLLERMIPTDKDQFRALLKE